MCFIPFTRIGTTLAIYRPIHTINNPKNNKIKGKQLQIKVIFNFNKTYITCIILDIPIKSNIIPTIGHYICKSHKDTCIDKLTNISPSII